jgi:hypothetical protein
MPNNFNSFFQITKSIQFFFKPKKSVVFIKQNNFFIFYVYLDVEKLIFFNIKGHKKRKQSSYSLRYLKFILNFIISSIHTNNKKDFFDFFIFRFIQHILVNPFSYNIIYFYQNFSYFFKKTSYFDSSKSIVTAQKRFFYQRNLSIINQATLIHSIKKSILCFFNKLYSQNNQKLSKKKLIFGGKKLYSIKYIPSSKQKARSIKETIFYKKGNFMIIPYVYMNHFTPKNKVVHIPFFNFYKKLLSSDSFKTKKRKPLIINTKYVSSRRIKSYIPQISPKTIYFHLYTSNILESAVNTNKVEQFKSILSLVTNTRFSFYQINVLSLSRYSFNQEKINDKKKYIANFEDDSKIKQKGSKFFLKNFEQKINIRYKYIAVFIKDLIRICFFSIYIKKAGFMANFFAYTRPKLPRNRKETTYVRFLIKLLKRFSGQRKERIGVRIRFQGRVNR